MDSQGRLTVPNGKVHYNGTTAGSVATYTCDNEIKPDPRTCGIDGSWRGNIPACGNICALFNAWGPLIFCVILSDQPIVCNYRVHPDAIEIQINSSLASRTYYNS
jgi:hypothetical protein